MTRVVELPLWLLILILVFAAVTASTHFLFPSVRWFFRKRAERVVARLNERLDRPIQPFKLARRTDMIQRLIYNPDVVQAVAEHAEATGVREDVAFQKARQYAREIVPSFSASAYFGIAIRLARWLSTKLFEVHLHRNDDDALAKIDRDATVVFVMNHRSNMDYVLVTYLAAEQSALSYAVGEWAQVWPLSRLIRAMGAYFIRRRARNALYRKILAKYVNLATDAGVTQAVFPEGGLSRNGHVGAPRLGIISYIVAGHEPGEKDVVFIPVALNYDRVIEDRILVAAGRSGRRKFRASAPEAFRFTLRYVGRRLTGRAGRFGMAAVAFGDPMSLDEFLSRSGENTTTEALGEELSLRIRQMVPVLPVPLAIAAILSLGGQGAAKQIEQKMGELVATMPPEVPRFLVGDDASSDTTSILDVLVMRKILDVEDNVFTVHNHDLATFYANSVRQHLDAAAAEQIPDFDRDESFVKT